VCCTEILPSNRAERFAEKTRQNEQPLDYAMMKCGNAEVMSQDIPEFNGMEIGASLTLYIEMEDIKELYARIAGRTTVIRDVQTTFYGMQEFHIRDCSGYILGFAEAAQG